MKSGSGCCASPDLIESADAPGERIGDHRPTRTSTLTTAPTPARRRKIRAVAVVIPAHDEQDSLAHCLTAVQAAAWRARRRGIDVLITVVADSCSDATRAIARRRGADCLTIQANDVSAARTVGVTHALSRLGELHFGLPEIYLLHTDAHTVVEPAWIGRHLEAAADHDAVFGPVHVRDRITPDKESVPVHLHQHGTENAPGLGAYTAANLGVRADAYTRAGGLPTMSFAEDRAVASTLRATGASVVFRRDVAVTVSSRPA